MKLISIMLCTLVACMFSVEPGSSEATTPTVVSSVPLNGAIGVALDGTIRATFSEAMDPATLTTATVTLTVGGSPDPIAGTVLYADSTVVFRPSVDLRRGVMYTATISTGANSGSGIALSAEYVWSFTGDQLVGAGGPPVNLRTAGTYVVLAAASISGTGATATGNLGISPAAASYITGFSLIADPSTQYSTSVQVIGRVYAADYGTPTPTILISARNDLSVAYADAAARTPTISELNAGNIGGLTLSPGVYRWTSGVTIPADLTLTGRASDVWIFQIAGTLDMSASRVITLAGGARPENVFWQVSGAVTLGAMAHLEGVVLGATAFTSGAGTSVKGRVLSQTDVTITGSSIVQPAPLSAAL
jgi:hypothetical protein